MKICYAWCDADIRVLIATKWSHYLIRLELYIIFVNPLSPNIHIQILQTDLYTFPLRIS